MTNSGNAQILAEKLNAGALKCGLCDEKYDGQRPDNFSHEDHGYVAHISGKFWKIKMCKGVHHMDMVMLFHYCPFCGRKLGKDND